MTTQLHDTKLAHYVTSIVKLQRIRSMNTAQAIASAVYLGLIPKDDIPSEEAINALKKSVLHTIHQESFDFSRNFTSNDRREYYGFWGSIWSIIQGARLQKPTTKTTAYKRMRKKLYGEIVPKILKEGKYNA